MSKQNIIYIWVSFLFFIIAFLFVYPAEDAIILFEYSKTFAETGQISYGNNERPIEGATDFLWMICLSFFSYFGIEENITSLVFSSIAIFYILKQIYNKSLSILIGLFAVILTPYMWSAAQGFSTLVFSAIYVFCILALQKKDEEKMYLGILLLCLVRPDGVAWGAPLVLLNLINDRIDFQKIKKVFFILIIPGLTYFFLRFIYFDEFLPLPFYIKSTGDRDFLFLIFGSFDPVAKCMIPFLVYFLAKKDWQGLLIIFIPSLFFSSMVLSQNIGNRYMAPMFFGGLMLLKTQKIDFYIVILLSVLLSFVITARTSLNSLQTKYENVFSLSKSLNQINGKLLTTEAGRLTYYSDWYVHDSWGLNTPELTKDLIQPDFIKKNQYDMIVAHCFDIHSLIENNSIMKKKTWNNQCKNIVLGAKNTYEIYLIPYDVDIHPLKFHFRKFYRKIIRKPDRKNCTRHDLYFVFKQSNLKQKLLQILKEHGAISYSKNLEIHSDKVCL